MEEIRLIDANKLEYCIEYLRPELEEHRNSVQRCIEVFTQSVGNQPTIDPETLPTVLELRDKLEQVTAERDKTIKDRAELSAFHLTTCEQFCFGDRKRDIAPCEWNWFGRCKLREWLAHQKDGDQH